MLTYERMNVLDSAFFYAQKANYLNKKYQPKIYPSIILQTLGNINAKQGKNALAMQLYREGMENCIKKNQIGGLCITMLSISEFYKKAGNADSSIYYAKRTIAVAEPISFRLPLLQATDLLIELY